ncbi:hypothetical protein SCP_1800300 [Sparassis crispa]|uniref:IRG-type G domain-containing protein n=1 Tax=Sparassis crispa TaxID=139825 RepID=A0A401H6C8_9APHY|nr:hypothetical protein SCP_1800300 [Sparassis crispa]GBE90008.1 hypothetical protein SCP_1800300 [Sparassis crispa]
MQTLEEDRMAWETSAEEARKSEEARKAHKIDEAERLANTKKRKEDEEVILAIARSEKRLARKDRRIETLERRQAEDERRLSEMETKLAAVEKKVTEGMKRIPASEDQDQSLDKDATDAQALLKNNTAERQARREEGTKDKILRTKVTKAQAAREDAEWRLKAGIQPIVWPTREEIELTKKNVQYKEGVFHIAIAGIAGSGKSSLINAFRGISNSGNRTRKEPNIKTAPTGIVETTSVIGRYVDPDPNKPFVWYDIPGAGTLRVPAWQYFNAQGLYIFDCIIVLFDNRFTETDIGLLQNCARFQIPSFIVSSKSEAKISAIMNDKQHSDDDDDEWDTVQVSQDGIYQDAREEYIKETNNSVQRILADAGLPEQLVYLVEKDILRKVVKEYSEKRGGGVFRSLPLVGKKPSSRDDRLEEKIIDEQYLLDDMLEKAYQRRVKKWWPF